MKFETPDIRDMLKWCYGLSTAFLLSVVLFGPLRGQEPIPVATPGDTTSVADTAAIEVPPEPSAWRLDYADMEALVPEDVGDYLKPLPGVRLREFGGLGQFSPVIFRGLSPAAGLQVLDDFILTDPLTGAANANWVPIHFLEMLSLHTPGPKVPLGLQPPGGALVMRSIDVRLQKPYSRVVFQTGDYGMNDIGIVFDLPITSKWSFQIGGNRQELDGFVIGSKHDGSRIHSRLTFRPSPRLRIRYGLLLNNHTTEIPAPRPPDLLAHSPGAGRKEDRADHAAALILREALLPNDRLTATLNFSTTARETFETTPEFRTTTRILLGGLAYRLPLGDHRLTLGGVFQLHDLSSEQLPPISEMLGHGFLNYRHRFSDGWSLQLQGKVEAHEAYGLRLTGAGQFNARMTSVATLSLAAQRGRLIPTFIERFWPSSNFLGRADLREATTTNLEVRLELQPLNRLQLAAAAYVNHTEDWIGQTALADTVFGTANLGTRTVQGVDLSGRWEIWSNVRFGLAATFMQVRQSTALKQLGLPEVCGYAYVEGGRHLFEKFVFVKLRLAGRLFGSRLDYFYGVDVQPPIVALPTAGVLAAKLTAQFAGARLFFSVENIFTRRYQLVPGFLMPPRFMRFGVDWEFWD